MCYSRSIVTARFLRYTPTPTKGESPGKYLVFQLKNFMVHKFYGPCHYRILSMDQGIMCVLFNF